MDEFHPERSVGANSGLSTPSSTGQLTDKKFEEDVNVQVGGDEEKVPIVDSIAYPDGGARAWSTIAGA
jgi:hypothetical protein